jgi:hypothetical protein
MVDTSRSDRGRRSSLPGLHPMTTAACRRPTSTVANFVPHRSETAAACGSRKVDLGSGGVLVFVDESAETISRGARSAGRPVVATRRLAGSVRADLSCQPRPADGRTEFSAPTSSAAETPSPAPRVSEASSAASSGSPVRRAALLAARLDERDRAGRASPEGQQLDRLALTRVQLAQAPGEEVDQRSGDRRPPRYAPEALNA